MNGIELSDAIRRSPLAFVAVILLLRTAEVSAEELAGFPAPPDAVKSVEEIIVRAKTLQRLQVEVFRAEDAFYDAFNAANSDDQFDIQCELTAPTGSRIKHRVCRANFVAKLEGQAAEALMRGEPPPNTSGMMKEKGDKLMAEMRSLALQRPEVLAALMKIASAKQSFEEEKARRCEGRKLFCRAR